jgi:hypothetical protein
MFFLQDKAIAALRLNCYTIMEGIYKIVLFVFSAHGHGPGTGLTQKLF